MKKIGLMSEEEKANLRELINKGTAILDTWDKSTLIEASINEMTKGELEGFIRENEE